MTPAIKVRCAVHANQFSWKLSDVVCEGWVSTTGVRSLLFSRRYCVLLRSGEVLLFSSDDSCCPMESLSLAGATVKVYDYAYLELCWASTDALFYMGSSKRRDQWAAHVRNSCVIANLALTLFKLRDDVQ